MLYFLLTKWIDGDDDDDDRDEITSMGNQKNVFVWSGYANVVNFIENFMLTPIPAF